MKAIGKPSGNMGRMIELHWATETEDGSGSFHELQPGTTADLVFRCSEAGCRLVLLGPRSDRAVVEMTGSAQYFGMRFRSGRVPALEDACLPELADQCLDISRIGGHSLDGVGERLCAMRDPAQARDFLESLLPRDMLAPTDACFTLAADHVERRRGILRVQELCEAVGLHPRRLERLFLRNVGCTPKRFIRLVRLRNLTMRLTAGGCTSMARLAAEMGYADQSHMIRDYQELTGNSPGAVRPGHDFRVDSPAHAKHVHRKK